MSYGRLTRHQEETIRAVVRGRRIHDLGAGDLVLAHVLVQMGATEVVAIDSKLDMQMGCDSRITRVPTSFHEWIDHHPTESIQVAFVSWPSSPRNPHMLVEIVERAGEVIYLGKHTDGIMCGSPDLFRHLLSRELLFYIPDVVNTLCVYGRELDKEQKAPPGFRKSRVGEHEERAGIFLNDGIQPYSAEVSEEFLGSRRARTG